MNTGGDITVQLRLESKRAVEEAKQAGQQIQKVISTGAGGQSQAGSALGQALKPGGSGAPPIPQSPIPKMRAFEGVAQSNANKAAGGVWNPDKMIYDPPVAPGAAASGGSGAGGGAAAGFGRLGAAGPIGLAILAVAGTMIVLAKAAKMLTEVMRKASTEASRLYAKALQSGAGMGFTAASDAFANALGVSEADVFRYGDAINYLNERMGDSIKIMAKTTPNLTSVNWEFQALWYRVKALTAVFANELAGTFRVALNAINETVKAMTPFVKLLGMMVKLMIQTGLLYAVARMIGKDGGPAGPPTSTSNRMVGSAWERMGFVVGRGSQNHAAETAKNTKRIASGIDKLVSRFATEDPSGRTLALPNGA